MRKLFLAMDKDVGCEAGQASAYETFESKDGGALFFRRGTIRKDFILRYDNKELWNNNERFYRSQ